ncbi:putative ribosomal protein S2, bacteria/mitochondria/plastid [Helianthus anomalus]
MGKEEDVARLCGCRFLLLVGPSMPLETFKKITYPVPANDSVQFMYLFRNLITKMIQYEQKKLVAAKGNVVKEVEPKIR